MKNIYLKIAKMLLLVMMVLSVAIWVLYSFEVVGEDLFLGWSYILLAIAGIAAIAFPVLFLILNPSKAKGTFIGLAVSVVIIVLAYFLADSAVPTFMGAEQFGVDESYSKQISTGLYTMYIFMFLSFGMIIYAEIAKIFK